MCGIAGLIAKKTINEEDYDAFLKSSTLMHHRGPDHAKSVRFENCLLIHYRLSIIDLDPRSNQPFRSKDDNYVCVYNGEIYNYLDLKQQYNVSMNTTSDTEVMLETFAENGENVVKDWNGIFTAGIINKQKKQLHLIRDRFGIKPLYIYENEEVILFASEAKVILDYLKSFQLNYEGLAQYLWYGNTISESTMIEGLYKVSPAHVLTIDLASGTLLSKNKYWDIPTGEKNVKLSLNDTVDQVRHLLDQAVKRQLVSDVPLGVLLSGGVDSSAIVAFASKYVKSGLDTYSVEYDYNIGGESELQRAASIAHKYNTNHHEFKIKAKDIVHTFRELVVQYDEPFADSANIPLYQLAKACSSDQKVILQGDGGDEFFAGYRRYNVLDWLNFWQITSVAVNRFIPSESWRGRMKRMSFVLNQKDDAMKMAYFLTQDVPYKNPYSILTGHTQEKIARANPFQAYGNINEKYKDESLVQRMLYADVKILLPNTYLEKVDKATMLCSVEARVPFLDNDLTDFALQLPAGIKVRNGEKKFLLKKALKGLVPDEILYGKKRGFDVPYKQWLKSDLYEFAKKSFEELSMEGVFDKAYSVSLLEKHKKGEGNHGPILWKALVLAHWLNHYQHKITI